MAETIARRGGLTVLPQDIPLDIIAENLSLLEEQAPGLRDPDHAGPTETVGEALNLIHKRRTAC